MSFNKQLLLKSALVSLRQAQNIIDAEDVTYEEVKAAATQASQASGELFKLTGILAAELQTKNSQGAAKHV